VKLLMDHWASVEDRVYREGACAFVAQVKGARDGDGCYRPVAIDEPSWLEMPMKKPTDLP
jgi:hypothetical protein